MVRHRFIAKGALRAIGFLLIVLACAALILLVSSGGRL